MTSPERLLQTLTAKGTLPEAWRDAVLSVPRELFLPETIEVGEEIVSRRTSPERWRQLAYGDVALVTQVNDGASTGVGGYRLPTSSSSMPTVMLEMLELLDVHVGQRALELGAGTGLNACWLAHRLGSEQVTSVDIDGALVEQAVRNAAAAGYKPTFVCGDGAQGWPAGAPYDRVIATYTVPEVPYAWVDQAPGGRIVTPWGGSFCYYAYAVLDVVDGVGRGRFTGSPAFMRTRTGRPHRGFLSDFLHHLDEGTESVTTLNPYDLAGDFDALFYVGLALPDAWYHLVEADDGSGEATLWLLADDRSSWAAAEYAPDRREYIVDQYGPRRLWDEAEAAYRAWEAWGRPDRDRAGLTVDPSGQRVWLDDEHHELTADRTP
ncbi:methyltransferase domain-containing protein [Streptomyces alkaliterrae]|uniref:Protein-L-isoaspartate O-methyltransferase n=1 Tax=Streptomyces alkaliterrae TaxID=2213162 RepID=A0A5P0Z006_9ACTN|nr:methyltransferase domain-containing protein [Streptomyces alkaliterrae]MBB1258811.1 methyltransferase domain-containing protein [Streptomyces alkaliterrae]MQS04549.1 methyltransferase domain-containing protein [Streptomyces alkaliterrae]